MFLFRFVAELLLSFANNRCVSLLLLSSLLLFLLFVYCCSCLFVVAVVVVSSALLLRIVAKVEAATFADVELRW